MKAKIVTTKEISFALLTTAFLTSCSDAGSNNSAKLAGGGPLHPTKILHLTDCRGDLDGDTLYLNFYKFQNNDGTDYVSFYRRSDRLSIELYIDHGLTRVTDAPLEVKLIKGPHIAKSKNFNGLINSFEIIQGGSTPILKVKSISNELKSFNLVLNCKKGDGLISRHLLSVSTFL